MQTCPSNSASEKPVKLFIIERNKASPFAISYKLLNLATKKKKLQIVENHGTHDLEEIWPTHALPICLN
jgi:hypothetical protein